MNKKKIIYMCISVAIFLLLVFMGTYAYFESEMNLGNPIDVDININGDSYVFTSSVTKEIDLSVDSLQMQEDDVGSLISDNGTLNVSLLTANEDTLTRCTYDVVWTFDKSSDKYIPDVSLPYRNNNVTYNYEMSIGVSDISGSEKDFSNLKDDVILKGEVIESGSLEVTTKSYDIYAKIYNLPVDQVNIKDKTFTGKVGVRNINCIMSDFDNDIKVYIETGVGTNVYSQTQVDANKNYRINSSKTTCNNANIINHEVKVKEEVGHKCEVYLDRLN